MKKSVLLICIIIISFVAQASHVLGGTIYWKCHSNGQYQFFMEIYRDCTGIPWTFQDETITIEGNPLPTNGISSFIVAPDSSKWIGSNNGDSSPLCNANNGVQYTCADEDEGTVQVFYYSSLLISLTGVPPQNGWKFYYQSPCCRPGNVANINTIGTMLLRAIMYPNSANKNVAICFDTSPKFIEQPSSINCRGELQLIDFGLATDNDFDSIVYSFDRPYNPPAGSPIALSYKPGFSFISPTPDQQIDPNNIPSMLNSNSGLYNYKIYSGIGISKYIVVIKADAYRNDVKLATVYRELPFTIADCPPLPSGNFNKNPKVFLKAKEQNDIVIQVTAGDKVRIPIRIEDLDSTGVGNEKQELTLTASGLLFSNDLSNENNCLDTNLMPCAVLKYQIASLDSTLSPARFTLKGESVIDSKLIWKTNCSHLDDDGSSKEYFFYYKVKDDHCPIPASVTGVIKVVVNPPVRLEEPIMKGISVNLDGTTNAQWVAPIDSLNSFGRYQLMSSRPNGGFTPIVWNNVNSAVNNYIQEEKALATIFPVYDFINPLVPSQGIDLFSEFGNKYGREFDFYMRMKTLSGCPDTISSIWSEPARVMELEADPGGDLTQLRSIAKLTWNRAKPLNASSKLYFKYESDTYYYIHQNDSVSNNRIQDSASWYIRDVTKDTTININSTTCNDYVGFRIEARDTVITFEQGAGISARKLDTLYFSTFSIIDTLKITAPNTSHIVSVGVDYLKSSLSGTNHQWIDCSNDSLLSTTEQFVPTKQGDYSVIYQNLCGFTDTTACYTTITLNDSVLMSLGNTLVSVANDVKYQWINCKDFIPIPLETNKAFVPIDTGFYAVIVSAYGYSDTSDCFPVFSIGIQEQAFQEKVSFYPNPTSGNINIQLENMYQNLHINIRNVHGQLVEQKRFKQANKIEFALKGEAGVYFIELINEKGERANMKVIKQ